MKDNSSRFNASLFYSYCHDDSKYRESIEKAIALLTKEGLLRTYFDDQINSGQGISDTIKKKMDDADIVLFLLSNNFMDSKSCQKEWEYAKGFGTKIRIPIILDDCPWQDLLGDDDIKALPKDGKPITSYPNPSAAFQEIYEGIKGVINSLRQAFTPRKEFLEEMEKTEFFSQQHIKLQDIFVFPALTHFLSAGKIEDIIEKEIVREKELLENKYVLIHGDDMSGKTALGRYLFLHLVNMPKPVLHVDLESVSRKPKEVDIENIYSSQFTGDYSLWRNQKDKTLILDNLSSKSDLVEFVLLGKKLFDRVIVTLSSDIYYSFFRDDQDFSDFSEMEIGFLPHRKQEELIRRRLKLSENRDAIEDGLVDKFEDRINSIIISNKIVPRYPFYILSIIQSYEGFMPTDTVVTAYGHCYYVLILGRLIKSDISRQDAGINTCLNFSENLAFALYEHTREHDKDIFDLEKFIEEYRKDFLIRDGIISRLKNHDYGIIDERGSFRMKYMYYFFLGKHLASKAKEHRDIIEKMSENVYVRENYLTLLFIIHHTDDNEIIDDILIRTACTLDVIPPAKLDAKETKIFLDLVKNMIPENILSEKTVKENRDEERKDRDITDTHDSIEEDELQDSDVENPVNGCYRILKSNDIIGKILRSKHGRLDKSKIGEMVETVMDSGLRLVNIVVGDEEEVNEYARYIHKRYPDYDFQRVKESVQIFVFLWTMHNIEKVVYDINVPEIREIVRDIVKDRSTPAFDIIHYFYRLDSAIEFSDGLKKHLADLMKKYDDDFFVKRVLSIRTQYYLNTHRVDEPIKQAVCSELGIKYVPKLINKDIM